MVRRRWVQSGKDDDGVEEAMESIMGTVSRHKLDMYDLKDYDGDDLFCRIARVGFVLPAFLPHIPSSLLSPQFSSSSS